MVLTMNVCMYERMYVCITYVCIMYMYICMYVCMYVCIYLSIYLSMAFIRHIVLVLCGQTLPRETNIVPGDSAQHQSLILAATAATRPQQPLAYWHAT